MSRPHLTVAVIVEKNDKFLMVKEHCGGLLKLNQPAGHVENNESIIEAAIRECLEETRWHVEPAYLLGINQLNAPNGITYLRISLVATAIREDPHAKLDSDISEVCWLSEKEIEAQQSMHRSAIVNNEIKRYRQGMHFPLEQVYALFSST
ncbi:NUDIX domain-containing protein [Agaribacterium sp. ZY112]|uniref:NUDIX domain-containing protein n=1 Tax=Agaribacterium sp. ZY112 TaxID=3233574 RepID=UPI003525774D